MRTVVVIPVYKNNPNDNELNSLTQCAKILQKHDICLVCPISLDVSIYKKIFSNCNFFVTTFNDFWFQSVENYSHLLLRRDFYESFKNYDFMLIYQTDAWVFKDDLLFWCSLNYSYIGAPWFNGQKMLNYAGNGGFSLRKVSDMLRLLSHDKNIKLSFNDFSQIHYKYKKPHLVVILFLKFILHFFDNKPFFRTVPLNEDVAIVKFSSKFDAEFRVAPPDICKKFSYEVNPEILYKINGGLLPFGCHAYLKYNPEFWKSFIEIV